MKKNNRKGFTLAELLIVVAIIGVLVAVAIPIFTSQLEKSREAVDEANLRSLYAECAAAVLSEDTTASTNIKDGTLSVTVTDGVCTGVATYKCTQAKDSLEGGKESINVGGVDVAADKFGPGNTLTITIKNDGTDPTIE